MTLPAISEGTRLDAVDWLASPATHRWVGQHQRRRRGHAAALNVGRLNLSLKFGLFARAILDRLDTQAASVAILCRFERREGLVGASRQTQKTQNSHKAHCHLLARGWGLA